MALEDVVVGSLQASLWETEGQLDLLEEQLFDGEFQPANEMRLVARIEGLRNRRDELLARLRRLGVDDD